MFTNNFNYLKRHLYYFNLYLNSSLFNVNSLGFNYFHLEIKIKSLLVLNLDEN